MMFSPFHLRSGRVLNRQEEQQQPSSSSSSHNDAPSDNDNASVRSAASNASSKVLQQQFQQEKKRIELAAKRREIQAKLEFDARKREQTRLDQEMQAKLEFDARKREQTKLDQEMQAKLELAKIADEERFMELDGKIAILDETASQEIENHGSVVPPTIYCSLPDEEANRTLDWVQNNSNVPIVVSPSASNELNNQNFNEQEVPPESQVKVQEDKTLKIIADMMKLQVQNQQFQISNQQLQLKNQEIQMEAIKTNSDNFKSIKKIRDLPIFNGDCEDWPRFIADFKVSTEVRKVNNIDNMYRLQKALKGKALEAVKSLLVHHDNVDRVIDTLEKRFGRPEFIINTLIEKVKDFKKVKEEEFEQLIQLATTVTNLTSTIEHLNRPAHLSNPKLIEELVNKLPPAFRISWCKFNSEYQDVITLRRFSDWLNYKTKGLVSICTSNSSSSDKNKTDARSDRRRHVVTIDEKANRGQLAKSEETANRGQLAKSEEKASRSCNYCKKPDHMMYNCEQFKNLNIEARWTFMKSNSDICANCFRKNHFAKDCKSKFKCSTCKKSHSTLLHYENSRKENQESNFSGYAAKSTGKVLLKIVPVILSGRTGSVSTFAFLDGGAKLSLIEEATAKQIGADGPTETLKLAWIGNKSHEVKSKKVKLSIKGKEMKKSFPLKDVMTVPDLQLPDQLVDYKQLEEKWSYISSRKLGGKIYAKPTILIGADYDHLSEHPNAKSKPNQPIIKMTKLGPLVHGPTGSNTADPDSQVNFIMKIIRTNEEEKSDEVCNDDSLHNLVKHHFTTENFGVQVPKKLLMSKNEERAIQILENTSKKIDGGWETGLLWKYDQFTLPNNYHDALRRLHHIERKMDAHTDYSEKYNAKMQELLDKGFARPATEEEIKIKENIWFLPHFNAFNPKKPEKFRIVHDAAAKTNGKSLNDFLLSGPDLYQPLPAVLIKFRQYRIGFSGDIKDMFPRIKIRQEDLPAQRFLYRGMDRSSPPTQFQMESMIFGAVCSPASAQFVKNKNAEEFKEEFPVACKAIVDNHYMDDYLDSCDSPEEAIEKIKQVIEIHKRGGFSICNWVSSNIEVLKTLQTDGFGKSDFGKLDFGKSEFDKTDFGNSDFGKSKILNFEERNVERVLGLYWDPGADVFTFTKNLVTDRRNLISGEVTPTKREVLRILMSIFDPLGFISPFTVRMKILLQDIWRSGIGWDDEIPSQLQENWTTWITELNNIGQVKISRCYEIRIKSAKEIQLHVFVDASEKAFAAAGYFRISFEDEIQVVLVMSKSRVAPLRPMSIPRLELQAAVMGSRLAKKIKESHDFEIDKVYFWSDSRTVICWLRSDARSFKPFVAHRVGEIEEETEGASWRWIPTKLNVADEATRAVSTFSFHPDSRWFTGPEFLKLSEDQWPKEKDASAIVEDFSELKPEFLGAVRKLEPIIEFSRFSSFNRLVRATAYVLRFKNNLKAKTEKRQQGPLTAKECQLANNLILASSQEEAFPDEFEKLRQGETVCKSSKLFQFSPQLNKDGLICMKGRTLLSRTLEENVKTPVLLDPKHQVTKLLILKYHLQYHHQGQEGVLNEIRQKYWILSARSAIRKAFHNCMKCRIDKPKPVIMEMGNLPAFRLNQQIRPFMETGIDYFGPIEITVGRHHEKRYGVLFTCMNIRAVHIEVAASLSTDSCIMAIKRFIARRGKPATLHSDNGTNFIGTNNELKKALEELDKKKIHDAMTVMDINWKFIPPAAPHMGGAWERLVRSVKSSLQATLKEKYPKEEVLITLLTEAESIVNSRPLTHVSLDPKDEEALTPNHFLRGKDSPVPVYMEFEPSDLCYRKQWKVQEALSQHFWRRWLKEYVPSLNKRTKWFTSGIQLKIGDVVFLADDSSPKGSWPRGKIVKTYPGGDGQVRVIDVLVRGKEYRRPVSKILVPAPAEDR